MWKFLNDSVAGTSHLQGHKPCQDFSLVLPYTTRDNEEVLIVACSDGAGSARESQVGSELACKTVVARVAAFLDTGGPIDEIAEDMLRDWFRAAHEEVKSEAARRQVPLREFSCTLLLGVIGSKTATFAQIGDGAIVILDSSQYRSVFWPDSGEYHNTTYFVTDPKFADHLNTAKIACRLEEVAFFTDGMQMLALNYATREAHDPFFVPMFEQLRANMKDDLVLPMRRFLDSKAVNDRTDDDKTLVLAIRMPLAAELAHSQSRAPQSPHILPR